MISLLPISTSMANATIATYLALCYHPSWCNQRYTSLSLALVLRKTIISRGHLMIGCPTLPITRRPPSSFLDPKQVMDRYCSISCGTAASVGVLSHVLYFVRGEHHQHTLQFLQILFYGFLSSSLILAPLLQVQYAQAMQLTFMLIGSYLTALWTSMLIYRVSFHRLNAFPGPRLAKLSKFYQLFTGLRLDAFRRSHEAHQRYGRFVRTGKLNSHPRLLSVRCVSLELFIFRVVAFSSRSRNNSRRGIMI